MSHNLALKENGEHAIAYLGSRNDVWHRLGQEMKEGMDIKEWAEASGLNWKAACMPAFFREEHNSDNSRNGMMHEVPNQFHVVRKDTNTPLGYVTGRYKIVQPAEVLEWFQQYIGVDDRFSLDVAGCLKQGQIIWATAKYNGDINVAGDTHRARLLMTTTFDGTGSTINKMTMTRVVCNNTLDVALFAGGKATVKTVHSAKFDPKATGEQLAKLAESVKQYKAFGDAMVQVHMSQEQVKDLFKDLLNMKDEEKEASTRKEGMFADMMTAYKQTIDEGTAPNTQWAALNAVTRYVDHMRYRGE